MNCAACQFHHVQLTQPFDVLCNALFLNIVYLLCTEFNFWTCKIKNTLSSLIEVQVQWKLIRNAFSLFICDANFTFSLIIWMMQIHLHSEVNTNNGCNFLSGYIFRISEFSVVNITYKTFWRENQILFFFSMHKVII